MANALSSLAHISLSFIDICSLSLKKKVLSKGGNHRFLASATRRLASWVWKFSSVVTGLERCLHETVRVNNKPSKIVVFISLCIMVLVCCQHKNRIKNDILSFASNIFPLMFGYKPFCLSAEYNETVVLRRYPIFLSGYLPVYRVSFVYSFSF